MLFNVFKLTIFYNFVYKFTIFVLFMNEQKTVGVHILSWLVRCPDVLPATICSAASNVTAVVCLQQDNGKER